jgi:3D (Asp-Asp-Asp) domain-containing protein
MDTASSRSIRSLRVERARAVTLVESGRELRSSTSRPTVGQALREAGVVLGPGDRVTPDIDAEIEAGTRIEVAHAMAVTIALPEEDKDLYTFAGTVGELLREADVTLGEGAVAVPDIDTPVTPGLSVHIVVLSASNEIEREFIESDTVYLTDASLAPGETRTEEGHDGALVRRYDVAYVDGVEAGRTLVEEYYDPEPVDTVIYYPPQRDAGAETPSSECGRSLNVYATYYTPASAGRPPSDPNYGRTATGVLVTYGVVAVDPSVIALGTRMFIPGYGYGVAADTGGGVKGYIIDLGYPDGVTVDWRSRWLDICILA